MKQLFQAYLTLGDSSGVEGGHHDISQYTDEEHLSGNRKRLSKMSGQFAALKKAPKGSIAPQIQIDCNPPSPAVAATNATYSYQASSNIVRLPVEDEEYIDNLVNIAEYSEQSSKTEEEEPDLLAQAAAKIASKISRAITAEIDTAGTTSLTGANDSPQPPAFDPNAITLELPVLDFEPPKSENRSGLSGSFPRQSMSGRKMTHWTSRKSAGADVWDSRVEQGLQAYEKNSKYTSSYDNLPIVGSEMPEGSSFIEMQKSDDAPGIGSFGSGEVKMIASLDSQGAGIRRLSTLRNSMKMIECRDNDESKKSIEPSNSYDAFNSFVSYKSSDSEPKKASSADEVSAVFAASFEDALNSRSPVSAFETASATDYATCDTVPDLEPILVQIEQVLPEIGCLDDLISECMDAAVAFEDTNERDNLDTSVISFAPEQIVEGHAGNFSVTLSESLAVCEKDDVDGHIHEQICFDPKAFSLHTFDGEPIEASCVFDSAEKLSFKASQNVLTNLESMFNLDPLSQIEEANEEGPQVEVEIDSVSVVSIEDCELLEIAAVGGKPSRQRAKGTSRSKKTQTRKEKKSKKRAAANA